MGDERGVGERPPPSESTANPMARLEDQYDLDAIAQRIVETMSSPEAPSMLLVFFVREIPETLLALDQSDQPSPPTHWPDNPCDCSGV